jgi:serine protease Do
MEVERMKRIFSLLLAVALVLMPLTSGSVQSPTTTYRGYPVARVLVDGQEVVFDVPAHIVDGRTLVPLRFVTEAMGAEVNWFEESSTVTVETSGKTDMEAKVLALESELTAISKQLDSLKSLINELALAAQSPSAIVTKVKPSVVGILATKIYDDQEEIIDQGTGVIISEDGLIVTNAHVVKQRDLYTTDVFVIFNDGKVVRAELINWDYLSDIAIVKVAEKGLPSAPLGNSDQLEAGQQVLAIGNPLSLGLRNTVTAGVVSGLNRADQSAYPLIQTDAAINSGNSGGPLVNYKGEVIGITSSKIAAFGVEGLGFAIPINVVRDIIHRFTVRGIVRPFLGVVVDEPPFVSMGIPGGRGLTIVEVAPGSPAQQAGIRTDDAILTLNGTQVISLLELRKELERYMPGEAVKLRILRTDTELEFSILLSEMATEDDSPFEFGALYAWEAEF